jgi:23S rRNA pseudouridine1911/1915/1917 synthase
LNLAKDDSGIGDRAGIVHRLDKETSGVLLVAKTKIAFSNLQKQFIERTVAKKYLALVHAKFNQQEYQIKTRLERSKKDRKKFQVSETGREAETEFNIEKLLLFDLDKFANLIFQYSRNRKRYLENNAQNYSLLEVFPKTGRTHQIRVHLADFKHPLVSDPTYCPSKLFDFDKSWCPRLFLHASQIEFLHPKSKKLVRFNSDLPFDLQKALQYLVERRA